MTDTWRSLSSLQTLLADNTSGAISAQDLRDMLVSVYPTVRVKDADETVNDSNTLQDDDDLTFPIGANETWAVECWLLVQSNGDADFQFAFSAPSGATKYYSAHPTMNLSTAGATTSFASSSGGYSIGTTYDLDAVPIAVLVRAVVINGSTPGDVTLQWAQFTADESDTKVLKGSYLIGRRLA